MSKVRLSNGEDHPEAAGKHLDDAQLLYVNNRWDGAAYLSGYVVECALKAAVLAGSGGVTDWGRKGHDLSFLAGKALAWLSAAAFSGRAAKYSPTFNAAPTIAAGWQVDQRYLPPGHVREPIATTFLTEAESVYKAVVIEMIKDGLL